MPGESSRTAPASSSARCVPGDQVDGVDHHRNGRPASTNGAITSRLRSVSVPDAKRPPTTPLNSGCGTPDRYVVTSPCSSFIDAGLPFLWWSTPSTWSPGTHRALEEVGAVREDSPGMHVDLRGLTPTGRPVDVLVLSVAKPADLDTVAGLMLVGFAFPHGLEDSVRQHLEALEQAGLVVETLEDVADKGDILRNWELVNRKTVQAVRSFLPFLIPPVQKLLIDSGVALCEAAKVGAFLIGHWRARKPEAA